MVKFLPVENPDKPVPKQVYNYTIVFLACCASFASLLIGYDSAFLGGTIALPAFKHAFGNLDPNTSGNLVITYQAGAVVGAMLAYPMGFYWGRRWALISCAMTFLIAAIVMVIASPSTGLAPIYAGRTVAGLAIGAASNLTPLYIGEIAPTSIRGMLVGIFELGWQVGAIIGFFINYAVSIHYSNTSKEQWLIPFAVQLIPGGLFALTAPFLIESPRWLLSKDRNDEAIARLTRIRKLPADHEYIVDEVAMMTTALEAERADIGTSFWAPWRRIFSRQMIFRPFLSFMCFFFQNASSINAINYYSPTILKSFGIDSLKIGLLGTGVFGILKGVAAVVWLLFLVDQWGRRKIFIAGCAGCSVFLWWIALYLNIAPAASYTRKSGDSVSPGSMATLVAFYLWTIR
jgi:sugar porter (SP) family MFS transporter